MDEVKLALTDISKSLESLVVRPPDVSTPAQRAMYQVVLAKQIVAGELTYRQFRLRIADWDKRHK